MAERNQVGVWAIQVPRMSNILRSSSQFGGENFDIELEYLKRKEYLRRHAETRERRSESTIGSSSLARKIIQDWNEAPIEVKGTFEKFLIVVGETVGSDLSSDDLHDVAETVFDAFREDKDLTVPLSRQALMKKKEEISQLIGPVTSDESLKKCAELAMSLLQWQKTQPGLQQQKSPSINEPLIETGEFPFLMENEFGHNIKFNPLPAPSMLEASPEDEWWLTDEGELDENLSHMNNSKEQENSGLSGEGTSGENSLLRWLKGACESASKQSGSSQFSGDELAMAVFRVLSTERSGDEIAGDLFDLIGDAGFEVIEEMIKLRKGIVNAGISAMALLKEEKDSINQHSTAPRHGAQVSIQTESGKLLDKLKKREEKRIARARAHGSQDSAIDPEAEWLSAFGGFSALIEASENSKKSFLEPLIGKGTHLLGVKALPEGTVRKTFKGYEEVHVPPKMAPGLSDNNLVKISELEDFAQLAFQGYKTLNRIQSKIYQTAFYSNENLLVCAPTGAGKTNIAMITILHEVGQNILNGVVQKSQFKIVYVAPMKALAAEMTAAFGRRLSPLGLSVRELTGDMQLTKRELEETQMIVTTPEKWDVITRKSSDVAMASLVKLLIIDEVHLLNDERGPVIETIVARTLRQVESSQSMIRIVGLSATLPNYQEVAQFLHVNLSSGLFYFDASYRPVPLKQQYIGVTEHNFTARNALMHEICYSKALEAIKKGKQAMVFVHSRKDTVKTARTLVEISRASNESNLFEHPETGIMKKEVSKSRNRELVELFESGFGIHNAGMLRSDRNLTEKLFSMGYIKVLVCTATLAWGVNLPAHTVIIKGTQLYDPKAGGFRELSMLDVMQIFGRAGRPQFDTSGEGIIITTHNKLAHYLRLLTHQLPIESQFVAMLKDNLNAEVVLGTVSNVKEACNWLGYSYLYVRMQANPLVYGLTWEDVALDPGLVKHRKDLIVEAARALDGAKMMRFDERSGNLYVTELGRVASHFYIQYRSVQTYNEILKRHMSDVELIDMVAHSSEFENIVVREEEQPELLQLRDRFCPLEVKGGMEDKIGKVNVLIQVYLSRAYLDGFSLIADSSYISASLGRIMRALFEICLKRGWSSMAALLLEYAKAVDKRIWPHQHPLRQFDQTLSPEILYKLEQYKADMDKLYDMDEKEIGALIRHTHGGKLVHQCIQHFPSLSLSAQISPITRTVLKVTLTVYFEFTWKDKVHGSAERWWIWVEDSENEYIYHTEYLMISKKMAMQGHHTLSFTIPIFEPLPSQYYVRAVSDTWLGAESIHTISFKHLILPERHPPHTELLNLRPLPVSALKNPSYESLYGFSHFNPIQTQAFHTLYHTDNNVLLGAPTGSGKTVSAELSMFRLFNVHPGRKVVYIAPLKALVKERIKDWGNKLVPRLGKTMVELTGEFTPDLRALLSADIIICTPEKWDGISRNWHNRTYAQQVGLIILDEIHLLGGDRGPILEVIVSRMRYIASETDSLIRFVGLSTALANAKDLGEWLGISGSGLYNFKPSVRPVPLDVHIQGYPGKFYCPRMALMNKPTYAAILTHSPTKPVLVFVSSRRQTRLTALDLIQFASADERPRQFVNLDDDQLQMVLSQVISTELRHTLQFGIGLHHAGLSEKDRNLVEELFANRKIQVLVCTSTLAWGVNLPAHLVVVKGTEYFDGTVKRYVDLPITDVLQMMGRAGRPQFDHEAKAVILVHEPKKSFFKKFLYEPFPVESSLHLQLHDHINAEVTAGSISTTQDAIDYLTWTYFFRRLLMNPTYYGLEETTAEALNQYLSDLVFSTLEDLERAGCLLFDSEEGTVESLFPGKIASTYYLHFTTVALFTANIKGNTSLETLLKILSGAAEYDLLPVRHNEDKVNAELAKIVPWQVDAATLDDPHTKANLLFQMYFEKAELPMADYETDTKSILDQSVRILQAMVDVSANGKWLQTTLRAMNLMQMVLQGIWCTPDADVAGLKMLPHWGAELQNLLNKEKIYSLPKLLEFPGNRLREIVRTVLHGKEGVDFMKSWSMLPRVSVNWKVVESGESLIAVEIQLRRRRVSRDQSSLTAFAPRFPKSKDEGWWLVLGKKSAQELISLKRVTFSGHVSTKLVFPSVIRETTAALDLYLVSDCYIGLDQHHVIPLLSKFV